MKGGLPSTPTIAEYLSSFPSGTTVGFDPNVHTINYITKLTQALNEKDIQIRAMDRNLVDSVWGSDQPTLPKRPIRVQLLKHAGLTVKEKLARIREKMSAEGAGAMVVSSLDEVCWLYNIRGCDSDYNQLTLAYALISAGKY